MVLLLLFTLKNIGLGHTLHCLVPMNFLVAKLAKRFRLFTHRKRKSFRCADIGAKMSEDNSNGEPLPKEIGVPDWFAELKCKHTQFVNEDDVGLSEQEVKNLVAQRMLEAVLAQMNKKAGVEITEDETAYLVERLKTTDLVTSNAQRKRWIAGQPAGLRTEENPKWDYPDYKNLLGITRRLALIWSKPYDQPLVRMVLAQVFDLSEEQLSRVYPNNTKVWHQRIAHVLSTMTRKGIHEISSDGNESVYKLIATGKGTAPT
jgi:hypothetical protein